MQVHAHADPVRLAAGPDDYGRFGLEKGHVQGWEDGLRLDTGDRKNIEWWYFDSLLDDGAKLSVIFCTKDASRPHQPLEPLIEIDLDLPDGRRMMKYGRFKADEFKASKDGCDVRMGDYRFAGDLHEYHITGKAEDVSAEVRLESITEPWRPETGHLVFGARGRDHLRLGSLRACGQGDGHLPHRLRGPRGHGHGVPRPQLDEPGHGAPDRPLVLGTRTGGSVLFVTAYITVGEALRLRGVPVLHARPRRQGDRRRRLEGDLREGGRPRPTSTPARSSPTP